MMTLVMTARNDDVDDGEDGDDDDDDNGGVSVEGRRRTTEDHGRSFRLPMTLPKT